MFKELLPISTDFYPFSFWQAIDEREDEITIKLQESENLSNHSKFQKWVSEQKYTVEDCLDSLVKDAQTFPKCVELLAVSYGLDAN